MQGIAEAIKYFYQEFILRDIVAYVTPGTILAACVLKVRLGTVANVILFIERIPKVAYVPIYGLLFITGLAIQNFGEMTKALPEHERRGGDKERFGKLQEFHHATAFRKVPDARNDYSEALERTRERIEVKKYASGNIAAAVVISAIFIWVTKTVPNSTGWAFAVVGAILVVSLGRAHRHQLRNVTIWENHAIENYKKQKEEEQ
jgi:hypothetical protein